MLGFSRQSWLRLFREGTWAVFGQVSTAVAGLIGIRLLTELAPKSVFGEASLLLGMIAVGKNFFVSPVINYQLRYNTEYIQRGLGQRFTSQIIRLSWQGTFGLLVAVLIGYVLRWRLTTQGFQPLLLAGLVALVCLDTVKSVQSTKLVSERQQGRLAAWTSFEVWLVIGFSVFALWWIPTTPMYLAANAAAIAVGIVLFRPWRGGRAADTGSASEFGSESAFVRKVLAYGLPFVPLALTSWIINVGDRYILGALKGYTDVGQYAAAYGLASRPMLAAGAVLGTVIRPILFHAENSGQGRSAQRVFILWLVVATGLDVVAVAALAVFGDRIAGLLLAPSYRQGAAAIMTWVGLGYGLNNVIAALEARLLCRGSSRSLSIPSGFSAVVNIGLNCLLIPRFGALGAAQATAGAFAGQLLLLIVVLVLQRETRSDQALPSLVPASDA